MDDGIDHIHTSYLEAILACNRSEKKHISFYENVHSADENSQIENMSLQIMQLSRQMKTGDLSTIDELNGIFDSIFTSDYPSSIKKYQCYCLIEKLQESMNKLGMPLSDEIAS